MSLTVTVTVGDKEFLMKTIPDTSRFDVPSSIALRTLSHELLEKKFLHPVFSLEVLEDHQLNVGGGDFASTFVNGDYFEHEETTLCASISAEAEEEGSAPVLTFYYAKTIEAVDAEENQQSRAFLAVPHYPWHWKFFMDDDGYVEAYNAKDLVWNRGMTGWARSLVSVPIQSLQGSNGEPICDYFDVKTSKITAATGAGGNPFRVYLPAGTKECWDVISKRTEQRNWIVSGSPGVGKTVSTLYFLRLLMQEKVPIILYDMRKVSEPMNRYYLFTLHVDGYHCFNPEKTCTSFSVGHWMLIPQCTHIVDMNQKDANLNPISARTVLVTTPDGNKIGDYKKMGVKYLFVPVPPRDIVLGVACDIIKRSSSSTSELHRKFTDVHKRMHRVGPILRRVLDQTEYFTAETAIKCAFSDQNCEETMTAITNPNMEEISRGKKPHSYLLMITRRDYACPNVARLNHSATGAIAGGYAALDSNKSVLAEANAVEAKMDDIDRLNSATESMSNEDAKPVGHTATFPNKNVLAKANVVEVKIDSPELQRVFDCVVVPVCSEAVAMAFDNGKIQTAKHFLSRHFSHLRNLQDGAGFENWITLALSQGILKGKAFRLEGRGPIADNAETKDVVFGDGKIHSGGKQQDQTSTYCAWLALRKGTSVDGTGCGFVLPNEGFPLVDFMDRKNRGGQVTLNKEHSVTVAALSSMRVSFGWSAKDPLHVLYIVSALDFKKFRLERTPPVWVAAFVVNAGELTVVAGDGERNQVEIGG